MKQMAFYGGFKGFGKGKAPAWWGEEGEEMRV